MPVLVERERDRRVAVYVESAFAFTPAAIISDANVCRHTA
jgi:hypothetical protein